MNAISRVVEGIEGGQAALARTLHVTPQFVSQWVTGKRPVPPRAALAIEEMFGVSRHELRPDVFGPVPGKQAEAS
ncbi:transcriptional regulator [Luteimonas sp. JM171]|uniref:transcriptional regulator n=1 Tax=Luteimonas sp. JM171 TaxID=1896164 RepID=UPI00085546C3|nr:YdaS family helix-turn-helix protein [Luteimonas sp. JM171]AOH36864.1 hypothetical protein BGP89_11285 [Luteimonas sp. JM171]